jgi:hypothetical protein
MMFEVGGRRFILRVLEATNTAHFDFAFGSGAREKVTGSVFEVLKGNVGFEECVDRRPPVCLECL